MNIIHFASPRYLLTPKICVANNRGILPFISSLGRVFVVFSPIVVIPSSKNVFLLKFHDVLDGLAQYIIRRSQAPFISLWMRHIEQRIGNKPIG